MGEALDCLKGHETGEIRVYAGGTDVIPKLKARLIPTPSMLLDLKGIEELQGLEYNNGDGLRIGALATISSVAGHETVQNRYRIISQGANSIASTQVQNRGTIAGNLCSAIPSADSAPGLLCLDAKLICISSRGVRSIGIEKFFTGPSKTALESDELVKEIRVPVLPDEYRSIYIKLAVRERMDLAVVGVGVAVAALNGVIKDARIGLGAVAPTPVRAKKAEETLRGEKAKDGVIAEAGRLAAEASAPISDHRASAEYRKIMVEVLVKRALKQALKG